MTDFYFDNAAAAPVPEKYLTRLQELSRKYYANQEALGAGGINAVKALREAEEKLCESLLGERCESHVLWTNSGTEALRAAIEMTALKHPGGGEILYSAGEHPSLRSAIESLPEKFGKREVSLQKNGLLDPDHLSELLSPKTILVALHHVHPETGVIQDLAAIRKTVDKKNSKALLLADTIQSACKLNIPWNEARLDFAALSGQKIGALSGSALFYRKHDFEKTARSLRNPLHSLGRVPPPLALALSEFACDLAVGQKKNEHHAAELKALLFNKLQKKLGSQILQTVPNSISSPYILHLLVQGCQGAILCRSLASQGISVAPGSACESETNEPSKVLVAMGLKKHAYEALRISFYHQNTADETSVFADKLIHAIHHY